MKMKRWTPSEVARLRKEYGAKPKAELAAEFGRSVESVLYIAWHYGFTTKRRNWRSICASHKPRIDLRRQSEAQ